MRRLALFKVIVFLVSLVPLSLLLWNFFTHQLGANPFEVLTRESGLWTLRFLLITLTMRPLRQILQQSWPLLFRRMFGLFTFFYACFHLTTYLWFDHFFEWQEIWTDIVKRPFITVGMLAFVLLIPLAVTSTRAMMRRLGKNWQRLHRLVYLIASLGVLHFLWLVKADLREPLIYLGILLLLLGYRYYKYSTKSTSVSHQRNPA